MKKEIDAIGFGALNYDRLYLVDKVPETGDEIVIRKRAQDAGGSAANTIVGMARLGQKTGFIGIVGFDREGKIIKKVFEVDKVDTRGVTVTPEAPTGLVIGFVNNLGERTLSVYPGANNNLEVDDISLSFAQKAKIVHLSSFVGDKQFEEQIRLVEELRHAGNETKISFSPGMLYVERGLDQLNPIIENTDILFLSEREIESLTKMKYARACSALHKKGVKTVIVTLGVKGCYVSNSNDEPIFVASQPPQKVVDTTGAGDAFAAGFLTGVLRGESLRTCAAYGNNLATEKLMKFGARKGLVYSIKDFSNYQVSLLDILKKKAA